MKIIFFGSDDFAATHLEALINSKVKVCACVCPPDKSKGRGMKVSYSPVKEVALKNNIEVFQPLDLTYPAFMDKLKSFQADLFVVIAYGKILPQAVLDIPKIFSINVHASLLPQYRGAAPINWAIINGDKESGITIIKMNAKMDAGEIVSSASIAILDSDTAITLRAKMMQEGPRLLTATIKGIEKGIYNLILQDEKKVTLAPKLNKDLGKIDWKEDANLINNKIRGLLPWPSAYTSFQGKMLKVLSAQVFQLVSKEHKAGEVISLDKNGFVVAAKNSALLIKEVHPQDSKQMSAFDFTLGHDLKSGYIFG